MAKTRERRAAREFYMQFKEQKEIATLVDVSEKTVSQWAIKYGWKAERDARVNGGKSNVNAIKDVIGKLTQQRLDLFDKAKEADEKGDNDLSLKYSKQAASIADEISKYNKTLENLDQSNRISLSVYLEVMDEIFTGIKKEMPKIYMQLLDYQESHLSHISTKYN